MDLAFTSEEQAFREKIRAWVRDNLPKDISEKVRNSIHLTRDDQQRWAKILGKQGWHGWGWPRRSSAARAGTRSRSTCSRRRRRSPARRASSRSGR